jgi:hypothetical protein
LFTQRESARFIVQCSLIAIRIFFEYPAGVVADGVKRKTALSGGFFAFCGADGYALRERFSA